MSVIQILDDADVAFRISGAELRTVLSATTMLADKPHRLNGRTSVQRVYASTILPPVTALTVGLPAQRAIAQRFSAIGPSCRFAAAQQFGRFRAKADMNRIYEYAPWARPQTSRYRAGSKPAISRRP